MSRVTQDILFKGRKIIDEAIRQELSLQGHRLTGGLERSLTAEFTDIGRKSILEGFIADYSRYVNKGFPAKSASFKQFPFVVKFWQLRGLDEKTAKQAAAATIKKWQKQGMPTADSSRFSKDGERKNFLPRAFRKVEKRVNAAITKDLNAGISKEFLKTKSEMI